MGHSKRLCWASCFLKSFIQEVRLRQQMLMVVRVGPESHSLTVLCSRPWEMV